MADHNLARKAARMRRDAEKHEIEHLAVAFGSSALRRGDVQGALDHLAYFAPQYQRILEQERLDVLADV